MTKQEELLFSYFRDLFFPWCRKSGYFDLLVVSQSYMKILPGNYAKHWTGKSYVIIYSIVSHYFSRCLPCRKLIIYGLKVLIIGSSFKSFTLEYSKMKLNSLQNLTRSDILILLHFDIPESCYISLIEAIKMAYFGL